MFNRRYRLDPGQPSWSKPLVYGALAFVVLLIIGMIGVRVYYQQNLEPINNGAAATITISKGATMPEIAAILKDNDLIRSEAVFSWYVRSKEASDKIQAGTYELQGSLGVPEIVAILTNGQVSTDLVTILPGQRLDQIRQRLIDSGFSEADVDAALDPAQYSGNPALVDKPDDVNLEGFLYPESFQRTEETTPAEIITQSLAQMDAQLTPDLRTAFARQGLSTYEAIILASIVEQEAGNDEDRKRIAQVFLSRLEIGMRLQSDPTAYYGSQLAGKGNSLSYDSPYNTYLYNGLPKTPISNVSAASLAAVAYPAETDWLYFVAGDDGMTYFSKTLEEHERLTAEHCIELCQ